MPPGSSPRVAVVTGAASGIGRSTAELLARSGHAVVVVDIDHAAAERVADAIGDSGGAAAPVRADVTDPASVTAMATATVATFGSVDIIVNSAGTLRSTAAADIEPDEWHLMIDTCLTGTFLCSQALLPAMIAAGGGSICNVASMAGRATSTLGGAHYTAAKAGVLGLTRHLAREWAPHKITVNAVSPGIVDTPMARGARDEAGLAAVLATIPLGRFAEPAEVAALIAFLVSGEAAYVTGANVDIHGGELIIA